MLMEMTVRDFLREVASPSPAPGGGSAAALAGALAAALLVMVAGLSAGTKEAAEGAQAAAEGAKAGAGAAQREATEDATGPQQEIMRQIRQSAAELQEKLAAAGEEDAAAFDRVIRAYRLPKETAAAKEERARAIEQALQDAARHPLAVAGNCLELLRCCREAAAAGKPGALSDTGVAALLAAGGLNGALLNVAINLGGIKDLGFKQKAAAEMAALLAEANRLKAEIRPLLKAGLACEMDW